MQVNLCHTICVDCAKKIDHSKISCKYCIQAQKANSKYAEEQQLAADCFVNSVFELESIPNDEKKLDAQLYQLQQELKNWQQKLKQTNPQIEILQQSIIDLSDDYLNQGLKKDKIGYQICQKLARQEKRNLELNEELERLKKIKTLNHFYEIQINQSKKDCFLDGQKINFENLSIILPIVSYILKYSTPKGFERKCISEIYLDEGLIIMFETKNGKKGRDKEISVMDNPHTWINLVIQQMKNYVKHPEIKQKLALNFLNFDDNPKSQKQIILRICQILKGVLQKIDDHSLEF